MSTFWLTLAIFVAAMAALAIGPARGRRGPGRCDGGGACGGCERKAAGRCGEHRAEGPGGEHE